MNPKLEKTLGEVGRLFGRIGARAGSAMVQSALEDLGDLAVVVGRKTKDAAQRWADSLPKEDHPKDEKGEGTP